MPNVTAHHTGGNLEPIHAGKAGVLVMISIPSMRSINHEVHTIDNNLYIDDWNDDHNVTFDDCPVNAEDTLACQLNRYDEWITWHLGYAVFIGSRMHRRYSPFKLAERAGRICELPPKGVKHVSTVHWAPDECTRFAIASVQNNSVLFNSKFAKYVRPSRLLIMDTFDDLPPLENTTYRIEMVRDEIELTDYSQPPSLIQCLGRRQRFTPLFDEFMYRSPAVAGIIHRVDSWARGNDASNEQALRRALRQVVDLAERQREQIELLSKHNTNPSIFRGDE